MTSQGSRWPQNIATVHPSTQSHPTHNRPTPQRHVEWNQLVNALVEIRLKGRVIRTGYVEHAMPDSSALWIAADSDHPRQIFEACQGHQVWVWPQELPGQLAYRMTTNQVFGAKPQQGT